MIVSGWSFRRGRDYELNKNSPGTASIRLIDTTGEIDPTNPAYAFDPGTPAAIALHTPVTSTDHTVFRGNISRLTYELYPSEKYAVATLELVDGLDRLARTEMYGGTGFTLDWGDPQLGAPVQAGDVYFVADLQVAHRINRILDQAEWPIGLREVFSGNVRMQDTVYAYRTPALNGLLDAADAEFPGVANFYCQKDGRATFHGRLARFKPTDAQYHISTWRAGDTAAVQADSTRALIFGLDYDQDVEKIINNATATPKGIANSAINAQRVENAASIAAYGSRSISFDNLLTQYDYFDAATANAATKKFATYYVSNYKDARVRVNRVTFKRLDPSHPNAQRVWQVMCNVDISDIIRLKTTHQGGGFDEDFYVEGITAEARPLSDDFDDVVMHLDVSPRAYYNVNPWA